MAAVSYSIYCFEVLAASLEDRKPLTLAQTEELWAQYVQEPTDAAYDSQDGDEQDSSGPSEAEAPVAPSAASHLAPHLLSPSPASSASTPSLQSSASGRSGQSSHTSLSSAANQRSKDELQVSTDANAEHPLFVTWNIVNRNGTKSLRGCIGTFDAQPIESGLRTYALTSAFEDTRFHPISARELPSLSVGITLLTDFEPCSDPMDWDLGKHGLRISFSDRGKRFGATYLPDVAKEQGWSKNETMVSLMRKAGWNGRRDEWSAVHNLQVTRYQGKKVSADYELFRAWREWVFETAGEERVQVKTGLAGKLDKLRKRGT